MTTDLFLAASGWPLAALADIVPPSCRREIELAPAPRREGAALRLELPEWRPRRPARHLVPSFGALARGDASFRFELSVRAGARWSQWVAGASIGPDGFEPMPAREECLAADVDEFTTTVPVEAVRLRLHLHGRDGQTLLDAPWLVALSAWDGEAPERVTRASGPAARLAVPALSQMGEAEAIRLLICSPTSVAMVLAYHGRPVEVAALAREIFHPALDRYGVWPAAIHAAGRHGVAGYLLRFPDWESAAWCLARGLPIVASVRYGPGELTDAAIAETTGHLLVLTGWENDVVLVNDPAAPHADAVPRRYRLDELRRVWLERAGIGYVLFRPPTPSGGGSPRG
jgi:hypothetical protein